jgi:hypothetical protein
MSNFLRSDEKDRRAQLEIAQAKALDLFSTIERNCLIQAGVSEHQIEDEIGELTAREFGVEKHWHRRIVRAGPMAIMTKAPRCCRTNTARVLSWVPRLGFHHQG